MTTGNVFFFTNFYVIDQNKVVHNFEVKGICEIYRRKLIFHLLCNNALLFWSITKSIIKHGSLWLQLEQEFVEKGHKHL